MPPEPPRVFGMPEHVVGPVDADVGAAVRRARQRAGISLRELARRIGVSPATMSATENGRTQVTVSRLHRIADALGVPVGAILEAPAGPAIGPGDGPPVGHPRPAASAVAAPDDWRSFAPQPTDPVLSSAIEVFVRTGYHGATMRMIAAGAGMSIAGVYHHYASKQSLLVAALDLTMDELRHRVLAARADGDTPTRRFADMVEALALFHTHRRDLAFLGASEMRSLEAPHRARITALRNGIQYLLDDQVAQAVTRGDFRTPHPHDAARAVATMCTALPQWFHPDGPSTPEEIAVEYAQFALDLMRSGTPRAGSRAV
jgi:AcrR family transcriptional regulator/transcriptional regulator with XRE-family HTH domain